MGREGVAKTMMVLGGKWNDNKSRLANDKDKEWLAYYMVQRQYRLLCSDWNPLPPTQLCVVRPHICRVLSQEVPPLNSPL